MTSITLTKPIQAHGETVTDLAFREPNANDIIKCGFPFRVEGSARVFDAGAISAYMADLCGIPKSSVGQMSPLDWTRGMGVVMGFFADATTSDES
jgi:hypothetical protein